jgi:hypothetical protein
LPGGLAFGAAACVLFAVELTRSVVELTRFAVKLTRFVAQLTRFAVK